MSFALKCERGFPLLLRGCSKDLSQAFWNQLSFLCCKGFIVEGSAGSLKDDNNQSGAVLGGPGPQSPVLRSRRLRRPDLPQPPAPGNPGTLPGLRKAREARKQMKPSITLTWN